MKTYNDETDEQQSDTFDEYSTRDQPVKTTFYDRHGYDERDGPEEEEGEEERGYQDDQE